MILLSQIIQGSNPVEDILMNAFQYAYLSTSDESYVIVRRHRYDGRTTIKIQGPSGRRVIITNSRGRVIKRGHIPLTVFVGLTGRYIIDVEGVGEITLYVRKGMDNIVKIREGNFYDEDEDCFESTDIEEGRDYLMIREPYYRTVLEVRKPEGYRVEIRKGSQIIRTGITPVRWILSSGGIYRVIVRRGPVTVWRGTIEVWRNHKNRLYIWPRIRNRIEPMPEDKFQELLNMLQKEAFESGKLEIVRTAAKDNFFTSEQVKRIMETFQFDDYKVKAAKILYPRVVDRENFFVVFSTLTYSSSREELRKWIEQQEEGGYDEEDDWGEWKEGWD